ncbi:uncharacterized protein LOC133032857 [Cannabis sativa]|uniref:uncharacterized protein LOC133032857 n=1 Tax=Cannabis sativa TaxID=3483 RepID=UPI0029C9E156|nr:uncharacterized protein LOC133032857 [Cannabis sativa]
MNAAARNAMKAYSVLLPLFFDLLGFWKNRAQAPASVSTLRLHSESWSLVVLRLSRRMIVEHMLLPLLNSLYTERMSLQTLTSKFIEPDLLHFSTRTDKGKLTKVLTARMRSKPSLLRHLN